MMTFADLCRSANYCVLARKWRKPGENKVGGRVFGVSLIGMPVDTRVQFGYRRLRIAEYHLLH